MSNMIPVIAFANNKGGTGKTTCAEIFSEFAAIEKNKRVLVVDFDDQMNLTVYFAGLETDESGATITPEHPVLKENPDPAFNVRSSFSDIFYGKLCLPHATWIDSETGEGPLVDILCGNSNQMEELSKDLRSVVKQGEDSNLAFCKQMWEFFADPALAESYDLVVIDGGPGKGNLMDGILLSATHVVSPYTPEENSILGINGLINKITQIQTKRYPGSVEGREEPLKFVGLLPSIVINNRTKVHIKRIDEQYAQYGAEKHFPEGVFVPRSEKITRRQNLAERPGTIFDSKKSDPVRKACVQTCEHIFQSVFGEG